MFCRFFFLIFLTFNTLSANHTQAPSLCPINPQILEESLIHQAVVEAHETGNEDFLMWVLKYNPESIELRSKTIRVVQPCDNDSTNEEWDSPVGWEEGVTPLELAVRLDNPWIVATLISHGADVNVTRKEYIGSIRSSWKPRKEKAINETVKITMKRKSFHYTPLFIALENENSEIVQLLLDSGANPREIIWQKVLIPGQWLEQYDVIDSMTSWAQKSNKEELLSGLNFDDEKRYSGLLSKKLSNPNLMVLSIEEGEAPYSKKIVLSSSWVLYSIGENIDIEVNDVLKMHFLKVDEDSYLPEFLYFKGNFKGLLMNSKGEYLLYSDFD